MFSACFRTSWGSSCLCDIQGHLDFILEQDLGLIVEVLKPRYWRSEGRRMGSLRPAWATKLKSEKICQLLITQMLIDVCLYLLSKPLAIVTCVSTYALEHPRPTEQEAPAVYVVSENSKMDELQECCEICHFRQTLAQVN